MNGKAYQCGYAIGLFLSIATSIVWLPFALAYMFFSQNKKKATVTKVDFVNKRRQE